MLKCTIWTSACVAKPMSSASCSWWWLCYMSKCNMWTSAGVAKLTSSGSCSWWQLCYKLPPPPKKYGIDSVKHFYKYLNITTKFQLKPTTEDIVLKLLKNIDIYKVAGIDNLPGRFLKDGAVILAKPVTTIHNLSIKSRIFPDLCTLTKLKPIFRKRIKNGPLLLQTYLVTTFDFKDFQENCSWPSDWLSSPIQHFIQISIWF